MQFLTSKKNRGHKTHRRSLLSTTTTRMTIQQILMLLLFSIILTAAQADSMSAPETEVLSPSYQVNACEFSNLPMYCNCDSTEPSEAEEVKCFAWGSPENQDPWTAIGHLKNTSYFEFNNRPERSLKSFPPPQLFNDLNKLTSFSMKLSEIKELPSFIFANSSSLSEILLIDNMIANLHTNSFANMKNLSKINLGMNSLSQINRQVFVNLPRLQFLFLDRNHIQVIHDYAFKELDKLEEMDLQKNNLTTIAPEVFSGLKRVWRLELQNNQIEFLGDHVFASMPLLQELDLHSNQIRSISPTAFHGLKSLGRLNLQHNKIVTLQPQTFNHMGMIYMLDLRNNELETLSDKLIEPIYSNLKNISMQLMMEGNRLMCDCRILWIGKLYKETESEHVKRHLAKIPCDLFHTPEQKMKGLSVSYSSNVTVVAAPPEETTTYAFDSIKNVIDLSPEDFKCHEQEDTQAIPQSDHSKPTAVVSASDLMESHNNHNEEKEKHVTQKSPVIYENKKDLQQSQHQSHTDISAGNAPISISSGVSHSSRIINYAHFMRGSFLSSLSIYASYQWALVCHLN